MDSLLYDLRYGVRMMLKSPGFTLIAVLTLALGIGANTAMFSIIDGTLLRLPFRDSQRLVSIANTYPGSPPVPSSYPDFLDWRQQSRSFDALAASFEGASFNLTGRDEPKLIFGRYFSEAYFQALGVTPILGRLPSSAEHREGAAPVCAIGETFWRQEFHSSPDVIGQTLTLSGVPHVVVGVVPETILDRRHDRITAVSVPLERRPPYNGHGTNFLSVIGKLKSGVSLRQALADVEVIQKRIDQQFPGNSHGIALRPLAEALFGDIRPVLMVLLAAVGLVLLIACANVANLLLSRATARSRELAIREALGAGRWRLGRQLFTESVLLAALALIAAGAVMTVMADAVLKLWPAIGWHPVAAQWNTDLLLYTAGISLLTTVLMSLAPALRGSQLGISTTLNQGNQRTTASGTQGRLRAMFVGAQTAMACLLLIGSILLVQSLSRLLTSDPGFNPQGVLTFFVSLSPVTYHDPQQQLRFYDELLPKLGSLPGVRSVAATSSLPLAATGQSGDFRVEGYTFEGGRSPFAEETFVTTGYFDAMQIHLIKGRLFTDYDRQQAPKVVIINQAMAEKFWPGQDAIGKRVGVRINDNEWQQVIGVVADVHSSRLSAPAGLQVYLPALQFPPAFSNMAVAIRTDGNPLSLAAPAKSAVSAIDGDQPVYHLTDMTQLRYSSVADTRATAMLLGTFAAIALLLAAIGLYGVMAYSVTQRWHEIGVRMALGASATNIRRLVLGAALKHAGSGAIAGVVLAVGLTRFMRTLLFGVRPTDPATFIGAVVLIGCAALMAAYIPARRATRAEPSSVLRSE